LKDFNPKIEEISKFHEFFFQRYNIVTILKETIYFEFNCTFKCDILKVIEQRNRKIIEIAIFIQYFHHSSIISIILGKEIILKFPTLLNTRFPLLLPPELLKDLVKIWKRNIFIKIILFEMISKDYLNLCMGFTNI
jgi:hypothetical protein